MPLLSILTTDYRLSEVQSVRMFHVDETDSGHDTVSSLYTMSIFHYDLVYL